MLSDDSIVAIVTAVIGSGGFGGLTGWFTQHLARRKNALTRNDLKPIEDKLDRDYEHMHMIDGQMEQLSGSFYDFRITQLRQCLFAHPFDQNSHQSAIESGEMYIKLGGNGVGHKRLAQLVDNYEHRVETDDWDYTHNRP